MPKKVTMADIAKAAGVHQTTVSLALRNDDRLPAKTRDRIHSLAKNLGYRPNPLVSALIAERKKGKATGYGSTLAFLTTTNTRGEWRNSANYAALFDEASRHAYSRGYTLTEFWLNEPGMNPERLKKILRHRGVKGILLCPFLGKPRPLDLEIAEFATVALGYTITSPALDIVAIDYSTVMKKAIRHLLETRHRRIGFTSIESVDERVSHLSLGTFLAERYLRPDFIPPLLATQWRKEMLLEWVQRNSPDAIITTIAADFNLFYQWLTAAGYEIPQALSLVCVDCRLDSRQSGILQNLKGEAQAAIDLLTSRVERAQFGLPAEPQTILVSGSWKEGNSFQPRPH